MLDTALFPFMMPGRSAKNKRGKLIRVLDTVS